MESDPIDAKWEPAKVAGPYRIPWWSLFWFLAYTTGFAWTAVEYNEPVVTVTMVFGAAIWPWLWRLLCLVAAPLLPEWQAQQLRQRLVGGWDQSAAGRVQQSGQWE